MSPPSTDAQRFEALYRAHYAPRPGHEGPAGQDFKATVGVVGCGLHGVWAARCLAAAEESHDTKDIGYATYFVGWAARAGVV